MERIDPQIPKPNRKMTETVTLQVRGSGGVVMPNELTFTHVQYWSASLGQYEDKGYVRRIKEAASKPVVSTEDFQRIEKSIYEHLMEKFHEAIEYHPVKEARVYAKTLKQMTDVDLNVQGSRNVFHVVPGLFDDEEEQISKLAEKDLPNVRGRLVNMTDQKPNPVPRNENIIWTIAQGKHPITGTNVMYANSLWGASKAGDSDGDMYSYIKMMDHLSGRARGIMNQTPATGAPEVVRHLDLSSVNWQKVYRPTENRDIVRQTLKDHVGAMEKQARYGTTRSLDDPFIAAAFRDDTRANIVDPMIGLYTNVLDQINALNAVSLSRTGKSILGANHPLEWFFKEGGLKAAKLGISSDIDLDDLFKNVNLMYQQLQPLYKGLILRDPEMKGVAEHEQRDFLDKYINLSPEELQKEIRKIHTNGFLDIDPTKLFVFEKDGHGGKKIKLRRVAPYQKRQSGTPPPPKPAFKGDNILLDPNKHLDYRMKKSILTGTELKGVAQHQRADMVGKMPLPMMIEQRAINGRAGSVLGSAEGDRVAALIIHPELVLQKDGKWGFKGPKQIVKEITEEVLSDPKFKFVHHSPVGGTSSRLWGKTSNAYNFRNLFDVSNITKITVNKNQEAAVEEFIGTRGLNISRAEIIRRLENAQDSSAEFERMVFEHDMIHSNGTHSPIAEVMRRLDSKGTRITAKIVRNTGHVRTQYKFDRNTEKVLASKLSLSKEGWSDLMASEAYNVAMKGMKDIGVMTQVQAFKHYDEGFIDAIMTDAPNSYGEMRTVSKGLTKYRAMSAKRAAKIEKTLASSIQLKKARTFIRFSDVENIKKLMNGDLPIEHPSESLAFVSENYYNSYQKTLLKHEHLFLHSSAVPTETHTEAFETVDIRTRKLITRYGPSEETRNQLYRTEPKLVDDTYNKIHTMVIKGMKAGDQEVDVALDFGELMAKGNALHWLDMAAQEAKIKGFDPSEADGVNKLIDRLQSHLQVLEEHYQDTGMGRTGRALGLSVGMHEFRAIPNIGAVMNQKDGDFAIGREAAQWNEALVGMVADFSGPSSKKTVTQQLYETFGHITEGGALEEFLHSTGTVRMLGALRGLL